MDVRSRIQYHMDKRQWSVYRLAKESGLSSKTLYNMFHRESEPEFATLELICQAFGLSLAQFFAEGDIVEVTPRINNMIQLWKTLTPQQQDAIETTCSCSANNKNDQRTQMEYDGLFSCKNIFSPGSISLLLETKKLRGT